MTDEICQIVVFMRHGVAVHNVLDHRDKVLDPKLIDPPLLIEGKIRSLQKGYIIQQWFLKRNETIDLIVTSPLTRCLQTTTLAFLRGDEYNYPENDTTTNELHRHQQRQNQQQQQQQQQQHVQQKLQSNNIIVSSVDPIPIICKEDLRESFGIRYPDRRREKSVLMVRNCISENRYCRVVCVRMNFHCFWY
jgi:phosphohistidine phosphatase SixA